MFEKFKKVYPGAMVPIFSNPVTSHKLKEMRAHCIWQARREKFPLLNQIDDWLRTERTYYTPVEEVYRRYGTLRDMRLVVFHMQWVPVFPWGEVCPYCSIPGAARPVFRINSIWQQLPDDPEHQPYPIPKDEVPQEWERAAINIWTLFLNRGKSCCLDPYCLAQWTREVSPAVS